MHRKIWLAAVGATILLLALLIWKLDIPNWKKLDLDKLYAQPVSTVVYDASGEAIGTLSGRQNRIRTPLDQIPKQLQQAFIAAEDQRFYEHCGVSLRRIAAAALTNLKSGSYAQGASTITQQLIKLTHLSDAKTLSRKAQEAVLALRLERKLTKDEILECYLNTIYFGRGAYGVAAAADAYFSKTPAELTLGECALLAGIIKAPSNYAPHINPEKSLQRRDLILNEMQQCGFITAQQAQQAQQEPLLLALSDNSADRYGWFMDAALEEASDILAISVDDVLQSGYSIHTAFEQNMQDAADALFADDTNFPVSAADGTPVQAALVAMRPDTGAICAIVGGREYAVQRGFNRAVQMERSPGSAIKPVSVYAAAIDAYGFTPTSFVEDTPRSFGNGYTPRNAGGASYGTVTLREALSRSLNIATVDLADLIGIESVRSYALRFGLNLTPEDADLALSLGSMSRGVSPASLCAAYAALANGGLQVQPHIITHIENSAGQTVYQAASSAQRAVLPESAYMITDMLKTAATTGSARALADAGIPVAAKTGTVSDADGSTRDVWTAACTPDLALTVWMGYDLPDASHQLPSSEGGSGYPARLCASMLKECSDLLSGRDFDRPDSVSVLLLDAESLKDDSVLLATENTPPDSVVAELFRPENLPQTYSTRWDAPAQIADLQIISKNGETPVLQFTALEDTAEYLVLRETGDSVETIASLTGAPGEILRFTDAEADLDAHIRYRILPRNRLLHERGKELTGIESAAVAYSPGGILDWLLSSGTSQDAPEAPDIEITEIQSIFG